MKTNIKIVILMSLVFGMLSFANAEVKNYYVNGVDNTLQDAKDSSKKIEIVTGLKMEEPLYNTTEGIADDLFEAAMRSESLDIFYNYYTLGIGLTEYESQKKIEYLENYKDKITQSAILKAAKAYANSQENAPEVTGFLTGPGSYDQATLSLSGFTFLELQKIQTSLSVLTTAQEISELYVKLQKALHSKTTSYLKSTIEKERDNLYKMKDKLQIELDKGNKINIIAHSQGNLFGNELLGKYLTITNKEARMFSVSTPDNKVFGERDEDGYITLREDAAHWLFKGSYPSNYSNYNIPKYDDLPFYLKYNIMFPGIIMGENVNFYGDKQGHNLVNVYLKDGTGSKNIIKESYVANYEQLKKLEEPEVDYNLTLGETRKNSWDLNSFDFIEDQPYNLYVPSCRKVRIDLKSSSVDTFLELVTNRVLIGYDNDSGYGNRARIVMDLAPGYYEIYPSIYNEELDDIPSPMIRADYELVTQDLGEGNCTPKVSDFYVTDARIVNKNAVAPGEELNVTSFQRYEGNVKSKDLPQYPKLAYFLSKDQMLDSTDRFLDYDVSSIGSDDLYDQERETLIIPNDIVFGKYYILFVANFDSEMIETNHRNNIISVEVEVGTPINDIYITNTVLNKDRFDIGNTIRIHSNISYSGNQNKKFVGPVYTSYFFVDSNSTGSLIGSDISTIGVDDLYDEEYIGFKIPENTPEGKAYILILTDYKSGQRYIAETNEDNNERRIDIWIGEEQLVM